jgi:cell division transport system permease protein
MMRALQYSVEEAIASLWRGRQAGLLSTATISLALFVLGGFLLVTANLDRLAAEWSSAAEMSVYLRDDATSEQRADIEKTLAPGGVVAAREHLSKSEALERFRRSFADLAGAIDAVGDNPLPESYEVQLQPDAASGPAVERFGSTLRQLPGVADVRYDREWLDRLIGIVRMVRSIGLLLGAVLTLAAALTVANVVRLAFHARRDEIEIMDLVGAPQAYVRGPFVVEGIMQGGIGAIVALVALAVGFFAIRARYLAPLAAAVNLSSVRFLPAELTILLIFGGMAVGCLGGLVAALNGRASQS